MSKEEMKKQFDDLPQTDEEPGKISDLLKIQSELDVPKKHWNKFGEYFYRNCEDILDAVKPLLVKYQCELYLTDLIEPVLDRIYVGAVAIFINSYGKRTEVKAYARETFEKKKMDSSQLTGAASSYARKYALNGLFLIDDVKDPDTTNKGDDQNPDHRQSSDQQSQTIPDENWLDFYQKWNNKIYAGNHVYYNDEKCSLNEKQIKYLNDNPKEQ